MCGITARVGVDDALDQVLTGLENLEYRGYDSAGIAVKNGTGLKVYKRTGEISRIKYELQREMPAARIGIGHTRWSTHGAPTDENAHPHTDCSGRIAVVHNGIIENYAELKAELGDRGHEFTSETDTEVVPHLVEEYLAAGAGVEEAFRRTVRRLSGSYAVAMMVSDRDAVYAARSGSPLVLGVGDGECYLASDVPAFLEFTDSVVYLEDGDVAVVTADGHRITDRHGTPLDRPVETVTWSAEQAKKGEYDYYMHKEINEQPAALAQTLHGRVAPDGSAIRLEEFPPGSLADVDRVQFVACGTSYHAALYATQWLSSRGVIAQSFQAGEYATTPAPVDEGTLVIGVTQSGETADTLEALRQAAAGGARTLAVTNVIGSTAARLCDDALFIRAGPEIGVAATKTFTSQVAALLLLGERLVRDVVGAPSDDIGSLLADLATLPQNIQRVLDETSVSAIVERHRGSRSFFFIGRGVVYPVALEGALKFKEITYEHAAGFAAGELKHGPLALVTEETPVFAVFSGRHTEKTLSNVREIQARGGPVVAVASEAAADVAAVADEVLSFPDAHPDVAGILANVQLQLVAYHTAILLGRPIDKPRNLAKSVTVQ